MAYDAFFEHTIEFVLDTTGQIPNPKDLDRLADIIEDFDYDAACDARAFACYLRQRRLQ